MSGTIRLTAAQAMMRWLSVQMTGDGERFIEGVWAIFGHGNVAGIGEALHRIGAADGTLEVVSPPGEPREVVGTEAVVTCGHIIEQPPHRPLSRDADHQALELHDAREWCVLEEAAVRLQPSNLLHCPPVRHFGARDVGPDVMHDPSQGPSILRDLDGELGQGLGEFCAFVVPMTALNEFEAERCSGEMILQVDVER